eukprot:TRINITY_DN5683_c0_g1_i3.p1 TRINITY_DN5683_c0_g1~~TRINITY_DN5683_c0_g1_i3.p1  ORF type:complete len:1153 (+),score=225.49 TRINITY_DN5683_c0_g1_i3:141-3599(+)
MASKLKKVLGDQRDNFLNFSPNTTSVVPSHAESGDYDPMSSRDVMSTDSIEIPRRNGSQVSARSSQTAGANGDFFRSVDETVVSMNLTAVDNEKDSEQLRSWRARALTENLRGGSRVLLLSSASVMVLRIAVLVRRIEDVDGQSQWPERTSKPMLIACVCGEAILGIASLTIVLWNWSRKNAYVYYCALLCFLMYTMWIRVSPLELTCEETVELATKTTSNTYFIRAAYLDCGAQGLTLAILGATLIFMLPLFLPQFNAMLGMSMYLVIYIIIIIWHIWRHGERIYYTWVDLAIEFTILLSTYVGALYKKFLMEKQQLLKYKLQHGKAEANNRLFGVLRYMLPKHVLGRVLRFPGQAIADRVDRASILFIEIVGFEQQVKSLPPEQLLAFLNRLFTKFDDVCKATMVTKIETVGQEYVAAVGVSPEDVELDKANGHQEILGRLVDAANKILKLQAKYSVQFKMGLHTGPIVAGVIGQKLPRFRLFGDTINTAARMMQKGVTGKLQFGEVTKQLLPDYVEVDKRGPIEMKGKGRMDVYLLRSDQSGDGDASAGDVSAGDISAGQAQQQAPMVSGDLQKTEPTLLNELGKSIITEGNSTPGGMSSSTTRGSVSSCSLAKQSTGTAKEVLSDGSMATVVPIDSLPSAVRARRSGSLFRRGLSLLRRLFIEAYNGLGLDDVEFASIEERRTWVKKFYNASLYAPVVARTDQQLTLILFATCLEGFTGLTGGVFDEAHGMYGMRRLWVYLVFRCCTLVIIIGWRWKVGRSGGGFQNPYTTEKWRLLDLCFSFCTYFLSYDALMPESRITRDMGVAEIREIHESKPYRIALWPMMFALSYMSLLQDLRLRFLPSVAFVAFSQIVLGFVSLLDLNFSLVFSIWQLYAFVCLGVLGLAMAHHDERRSLAEFDATRSIEAVGARISSIVNTLMPPFVVAELEGNSLGAALPSHHYRSATIAQSDLVGFTKLSSTQSPEEVVEFISDLFRLFDDLTDKYKVYKVETIGDAYLAGQAGMPLTETNRPLSVAVVATQMIKITQEWSKSRGFSVNCRVGVHTDECTGGIVGAQMQRYHLFGKLLSVVETLEATAPEGCVQMSGACKEAIDLQIKQEKLPSQVITMEMRKDTQLSTSKGDIMDYEDAGGFPTYIVQGCCLDQYIVT